MVDSNSPDNPNPHRPKNPFDIKREPFTPRPFTEPDPNYISGDKQDTAPKTDQETLFRTAAIRCAQMEDKLSYLMHTTPLDDFSLRPRGVRVYRGNIKTGSNQIIDISGEVYGHTPSNVLGWPVQPEFSENKNGKSNIEIAIKDETGRRLYVPLPLNKESRETFKTQEELDNSYLSGVHYYFTKEGEYKKVLQYSFPDGVKIEQPLLFATRNSAYSEGEMAIGDFELASQLLQKFTDALGPEEKPTE